MRRTIRGDEARQAEEETNNARYSLMTELDHIFGNAQQISCAKITLAIEALIDAKLKWRT